MACRTIIAALAVALLPAASAAAQSGHRHATDTACATTELRCASKVKPAFARDGTLWLIWMAGGQVSVAHSADLGRTLSSPVTVTQGTPKLDWGPDARPKIALDRDGHVAVTFSIFRDEAFNGEVFTSRSADGGAHFAPPQPITADPESQRFEAIGFRPDGRLFAAWLDKRDRAAARSVGKKYDGAALLVASSSDAGASYAAASVAAPHTCECCRLALAFDPKGRAVVVFRNMFDGGVRDHAVIAFSEDDTPGPLHRVSVDDWQIAACPHHGPSLSVSPDGTYHVVWYTAGRARKGLFYAQSRDGGQSFSAPMPLGDPERAPSRPYVLAAANQTAIVWKQFDGDATAAILITSTDDGRSWSSPRVIATTADASDHPLLVSDGREIYLSWMTKADGYRLQPIGHER